MVETPRNPSERLSWIDHCAWIVISVSLVGQVVRYAQNRGLRYDECRVALNLIERDYLGLTRPLSYEQAAPIGFLWVEKFLIQALGNNEFSLRLFPLMAGLTAPGIFWLFVRQSGSARIAVIGTMILGLNVHVQLYTGELKQYSADIATSALLLLFGSWLIKSRITLLRVLLIALAGAVSLWFSHPAVFVFGGVWAAISGRALFPFWKSEQDNRIRWPVALLAVTLGTAILGFSFLMNYRIAILPLLAESWTKDCWQDNFAPFPPRTGADVNWYWFALADLLLSDRTGSFNGMKLSPLFLVGLISVLFRRPWLSVMLVLPIMLALAASMMGRFGFADRQILFLQPMVVYLIATGIDQLFGLIADRWPRLNLIACFPATVYCSFAIISGMLRGDLRHWNELETRPILAAMSPHIISGEVVYVTQSMHYPFRYYSRFYRTDKGSIAQWPGLFAPSTNGFDAHEGCDPKGYASEINRALAKFPNCRRLWLLTAKLTWLNEQDVRPTIQSVLKKYGSIEQFDTPGVTAFRLTISRPDQHPVDSPETLSANESP